MEVGSAEAVIKCPRHPYTEAPIDAVPSPDPDVSWSLGNGRSAAEMQALPEGGCPFAPRCPRALPECAQTRQPLYRTDPERAVACVHDESAQTATVVAVQAAIGRVPVSTGVPRDRREPLPHLGALAL